MFSRNGTDPLSPVSLSLFRLELDRFSTSNALCCWESVNLPRRNDRSVSPSFFFGVSFRSSSSSPRIEIHPLFLFTLSLRQTPDLSPKSLPVHSSDRKLTFHPPTNAIRRQEISLLITEKRQINNRPPSFETVTLKTLSILRSARRPYETWSVPVAESCLRVPLIVPKDTFPLSALIPPLYGTFGFSSSKGKEPVNPRSGLTTRDKPRFCDRTSLILGEFIISGEKLQILTSVNDDGTDLRRITDLRGNREMEDRFCFCCFWEVETAGVGCVKLEMITWSPVIDKLESHERILIGIKERLDVRLNLSGQVSADLLRVQTTP